MNKNMKTKIGLAFPTNVRILQTRSDGTLIRDTAVKNRVLKEYGLYSYTRFILGSFNNNSIWDWKQYVPKFLAVGTNKPGRTATIPEKVKVIAGAPGTDTAVKVTDISLYNELDDSSVTGESSEYHRIKLNRANYIEDIDEEPYLKIQFEAYIPEDRYVGCEIGEMALMTGNTGWNAYARITGFPSFIKEPRTVVQIIWEITIISIESSDRYSPLVKKYLLEAVEKAIDVLTVDTEDPEGLEGARLALEKLIQPSKNEGTGLFYLLNDNNMITQDVINSFLSKPFNSLDDTGIIALINKFPSGENWLPSGPIVE